MLLRRALASRFQHGLRHLLDKQRNAVRAFDDVLSDTCGQRLVAGDAVDQVGDFALPEPIEGERGNMRSSNPRRIKFGPDR